MTDSLIHVDVVTDSLMWSLIHRFLIDAVFVVTDSHQGMMLWISDNFDNSGLRLPLLLRRL